VRQPYLDSSILDLEVDRLHPPGVIEAKQPGVMRWCVSIPALYRIVASLELAGSSHESPRRTSNS
jgi:hypothetical protein